MRRVIALMAMVALGLGFYLYPQAHQWYQLSRDRAQTENVEQISQALPPDVNNQMLASAQHYNDALWRNGNADYYESAAATDANYQAQLNSRPTSNPASNPASGSANTHAGDPASGPASDPTSGSPNFQASNPTLPITGEPGETTTRLTPNDAIGRVSIPKVEISLPIYHGATDEPLNMGAGHVYGTSLPVGGPNTHTVITAHSRQGMAGRFTRIRELEIGDEFFITASGQTLRYVVDQIVTVLPDEVEYLQIIPGEDHATLLTCTPLGLNSHRLLVRGVRAELPTHLASAPPLPQLPFPTWATWFFGGVAATGVLGALATKFAAPKNVNNKMQTGVAA